MLQHPSEDWTVAGVLISSKQVQQCGFAVLQHGREYGIALAIAKGFAARQAELLRSLHPS